MKKIKLKQVLKEVLDDKIRKSRDFHASNAKKSLEKIKEILIKEGYDI